MKPNRSLAIPNPVKNPDLQRISKGNVALSGAKLAAYKASKVLPIYLSKEEVLSLISEAKKPRDRLLLNLLWQTGARISEALNIRRCDIDRDAGIHLFGKGSRERIVPIQDGLVKELYAFIIENNIGEYDRLFKLTRGQAHRIIYDCAQRAGLQKWMQHPDGREGFRVHCHTLRHSFAVHFLKQTHNLVALQRLLGHRQITTTMVYLQIVQPDLINEVRLVDWG